MRSPARLLAEIERRLTSILQWGVVEEVDYERRRCRIKLGAGDNDPTGCVTTPWIPWLVPRSLDSSLAVWCPPEPGEVVLCVCLDGDTPNAALLSATYSDVGHPPIPVEERVPDLHRAVWGDGTLVEHDRRNDGGTTIRWPDGSSVVWDRSSGDIQVRGSNNVSIEAAGDINLRAGGGIRLEATRDVVVRGSTIHLN